MTLDRPLFPIDPLPTSSTTATLTSSSTLSTWHLLSTGKLTTRNAFLLATRALRLLQLNWKIITSAAVLTLLAIIWYYPAFFFFFIFFIYSTFLVIAGECNIFTCMLVCRFTIDASVQRLSCFIYV